MIFLTPIFSVGRNLYRVVCYILYICYVKVFALDKKLTQAYEEVNTYAANSKSH
jgi:hypothetical protein